MKKLNDKNLPGLRMSGRLFRHFAAVSGRAIRTVYVYLFDFQWILRAAPMVPNAGCEFYHF